MELLSPILLEAKRTIRKRNEKARNNLVVAGLLGLPFMGMGIVFGIAAVFIHIATEKLNQCGQLVKAKIRPEYMRGPEVLIADRVGSGPAALMGGFLNLLG